MKAFIFMFVLMVFTGCNLVKLESNPSIDDLKSDHIRTLYKKLPKIKFSFEYSGSKFDEIENNYSNQNLDSLIFENNIQVKIAGVFQDSTKFFGFIYFYPADEMLPILVTYDKTGKMIERNLIAHECGVDCGYTCDWMVTITEDYKIVYKLNETIIPCNQGEPTNSSKIYRETTEISQLDQNGNLKILDKIISTKK
ncbi:MAG: hypothetical protein LCH54_17100 [Bacteroidetes bacterium]|nr:hypothetical protein [Bacteroidota bacterium]